MREYAKSHERNSGSTELLTNYYIHTVHAANKRRKKTGTKEMYMKSDHFLRQSKSHFKNSKMFYSKLKTQFTTTLLSSHNQWIKEVSV